MNTTAIDEVIKEVTGRIAELQDFLGAQQWQKTEEFGE